MKGNGPPDNPPKSASAKKELCNTLTLYIARYTRVKNVQDIYNFYFASKRNLQTLSCTYIDILVLNLQCKF